jgi:hypothetical protein
VSRSIHTTLRDVAEAWRVHCAHRGDFLAERTRLRRELEKTQRIKTQVEDERRARMRPPGAPALTVDGADEHADFPASAADVGAILAPLPQGTTAGLVTVRLSRSSLKSGHPRRPGVR